MSRVIRGKEPKVVPAEIVTATERAREIVAKAEAQAAAIVEAARQEAEAIRTTAREEAQTSGRAEVAALLIDAEQALARARAEAEPALARLAVGAAERLLRAELSLRPERVRELVAEVLDRARRAARLRLYAHPADVPLLRTAPALAGLPIEEDPTLEPGDCVVESDLGRLDGRLSVRVAALQAALERR